MRLSRVLLGGVSNILLYLGLSNILVFHSTLKLRNVNAKASI